MPWLLKQQGEPDELPRTLGRGFKKRCELKGFSPKFVNYGKMNLRRQLCLNLACTGEEITRNQEEHQRKRSFQEEYDAFLHNEGFDKFELG
jgi:hypothetical protein